MRTSNVTFVCAVIFLFNALLDISPLVHISRADLIMGWSIAALFAFSCGLSERATEK